MSLQLSLTSSSDGIVGAARLNASDPDAVVEKVEFFTTVLPSGPRLGPFPPDRTIAVGAFEKDILLDVSAETRVEAVVTKIDQTTALPAPTNVTFAARAASPPPPGLVALNVIAEYGRLDVSVVPGAAYLWRCWIRRDAWPTADNTPRGVLLDGYMRAEANRDEPLLSLPVSGVAGTPYYIIAAGFNSAGVMGERSTEVIDISYGKAARPGLVPSVRQISSVEHWKVEAEETLAEFTRWLTANAQLGFIGEVGWPWNAATTWNEVAQYWFTLANQSNLWATAWAVGEWWGSYQLQPYARENGVWVKKTQAAVLEANLTTPQYMRGLNIAGAEFGAPVTDTDSTFSNVNPGVYNTDYIWSSASTYEYVRSQGHDLARIPFRWERIQPTLNGALDATELGRMRTSINAATTAGLKVILDVHNYGGYYLHDATLGRGVRRTIGSTQVTFAHFADLWRRLATEFNANPDVIAYGLMNEPVAMSAAPGLSPAETWEAAAQEAVTAIRNVALLPGEVAKWIMVGGYEWSGTFSLDANHADAFVTDPAGKVRYEAHQYFDANRSGEYVEPVLVAGQQENWVRWIPNGRMWEENSAAPGALSVELFRAGNLTAIDTDPLWRKGIADVPVYPCVEGGPSCNHKTYEYRLVVTDSRDGSTFEYATSISGHYEG